MRSLIGLGMVTAIAVIIIAAAYLLFNSVFSGAPNTVKGIVAASISVFVWVILWDPMESLLFNWVEPRMENSILRKLQGVGIVVRPKSQDGETPAMSPETGIVVQLNVVTDLRLDTLRAGKRRVQRAGSQRDHSRAGGHPLTFWARRE